MNTPRENIVASPTPTLSTIPTSSYPYDPFFGSATSSSGGATYTGSQEYPVFPNGVYLSKFALVSSSESGLTDLDIDLYNECYLPYNPLQHHNFRKRAAASSANAPRPTYLIDEAPCKRAAAINTNCYFQNTNKTFAGLQPYADDFDVQQQCYCEKYPFFDSTLGCMECFRQHGGIEGYHWFPQSYVNAVSSTYCAANPEKTEFYAFVREWAKTDSAASVPSTTAPNILGTQTAASLYYTYAAATLTSDKSSGSPAMGKSLSLRKIMVGALALGLVLYQ
ncbi:hypothetical protein F5884DRAFT_777897 [Xylogone sp. PMI_703]|nr:hypothetical protein F5884DRAFT_777897 [Xylogone sp. PMI_703]